MCERKCCINQPCGPPNSEWTALGASLAGELVWPSNTLYSQLNVMKNGRVLKYPGVIAYVSNIDDVQKCISFAKKFNLRVSIKSTGHSFTGRSTYGGSLQIYMGKLQAINVNTTATSTSAGGVVTVEVGNTWVRVYQEVSCLYSMLCCLNVASPRCKS